MSPRHPSAEQAMSANHPQTILVIDDNQLTLDRMANWLSSAGFHTLPAQNGEAGLALRRQHPCHLVLLDLAMPHGDGFEVLSTLAGETPSLPLIAIAGQDRQQDSIKALRLGAWDSLRKPVDHTLLVHQIAKALERAELIKENAKHRHGLEMEVARRTEQLKQRTRELEETNLHLQKEIHARQEIESKLKEATVEWQTTFDSMSDLISIHDTNYTIVKTNKALAQFLGKAAEELVGKKCCQIFHASSEPWATCPHRELLATGQPHTAEVIDPYLGVPLLVTVTPIRKDGRLIGSIHVAKDISRQKRLEEDRRMDTNLESIAVLCGGLAHDFNNLLAALGGYLDLAIMEKNPAALPNWLNHAKMVANLATELTKQLLTFSKGGTPILTHVSVPMLIQDSLEHIQNSFNQVRPVIRIAEDIWTLNGDHGQLRTVIRNIFYNAADAMPHGGTLTIEVHNIPGQGDRNACPSGQGSVQSSLAERSVQSLPAGDSVHSPVEVDSVLMSFTDQGIGISPEIIGKIFDPYFTTSAKGAAKGKGLGLALCHSIITKHHGQIKVSSTQHAGTTVSIYLPASPTKSS